MEMKMFRVRFDEMVRIEGVEVVSTRIGCDGRRVVEPEDCPSAKRFIEQIREDVELHGVFYLDEGDGEDVDPSAARIMTLSEAEAYVPGPAISATRAVSRSTAMVTASACRSAGMRPSRGP